MKVCTVCKKLKEDSEFSFLNKEKGYLQPKCKVCSAIARKKHYEKNKEKENLLSKKYYEENKEELKEKAREKNKEYYKNNKEEILLKQKIYYIENREIIIERQSNYYKKNKERINEKRRNDNKIENNKKMRMRYRNDENYRMRCILRSSFFTSFKLFSKYGKLKNAIKYGVDFQKIIDHLGPCPGKIKDYHIDHILPLSAFNFDNNLHIIAAFAPENHQWLLAKENLKKSNKYNEDDFKEYLRKYGC